MKSLKLLVCMFTLTFSMLFSFSCDYEDSWYDESEGFFEERSLEIDPEVILTRLFENLMEQNIEAAKEDYSLFVELFGEDFLPFKIVFQDDFESGDYLNFGLDPKPKVTWQCPRCGKKNLRWNYKCTNCGEDRVPMVTEMG